MLSINRNNARCDLAQTTYSMHDILTNNKYTICCLYHLSCRTDGSRPSNNNHIIDYYYKQPMLFTKIKYFVIFLGRCLYSNSTINIGRCLYATYDIIGRDKIQGCLYG